MSDNRERSVLYGPIELRDYGFITLCEEHEAVLLDGTTFRLAAGTKLVLLARGGGGSGLRYETGSATKVPDAEHHPTPTA